MKFTIVFSLLFASLCMATIALGQQPQSYPTANPSAGPAILPQPIYSPGSSTYTSGTAAEGALRGAAALVDATGHYNYNTGAGLVNVEEALSRDIANRAAAVDNYYTAKKVNVNYQSFLRGPKPSEEALVRLSKVMAPKRLNPYELDPSTGSIYWPAILRRPEFDTYRQRLEDLFSQREVTNAGLGIENYDEIVYVVGELQNDLKSLIDRLTPAEYVTAKKFLTSLEYEARFAPAAQGVATR